MWELIGFVLQNWEVLIFTAAAIAALSFAGIALKRWYLIAAAAAVFGLFVLLSWSFHRGWQARESRLVAEHNRIMAERDKTVTELEQESTRRAEEDARRIAELERKANAAPENTAACLDSDAAGRLRDIQ